MGYDVNTYYRGDDDKFKGTLRSTYSEEWASSLHFAKTVYGPVVAKELGLTFLTSLNVYGTLMADTEDDLENLHAEVQSILDNQDFVCQASGQNIEDVKKVMNNIINAIRKAREIKGGVVIW
jgi:hypothetical protein